MTLKSLFAGAVFAALTVGAAGATTIDFSTLPYGTNLSSLDGVTFSLYGGFASGAPRVGGFGYDLANSPTGSYPTAEGIDIHFSAPVSHVSFTFNDYGYGNAFSKADAGLTQVGYNDLSGSPYAGGYNLVTVGGSGITDLYVDNGWGGERSWEYGIGSLTFSVPEPATWALMLVGVGGLGASLRSRRKAGLAA